MKIKKQTTNTAVQTVDTLRKDVANSQFRRAKIKLIAFGGRLKRMYREYRLPSIATAAFLLVIFVLVIVRQLEQTSLLALRNEVTEEGLGYSALLSTDNAEQFVRDDTTESNNTATTSNTVATSNSTQSTSTPFVFGNETQSNTPTNSSGSSSGGSSGGTTNPGDTGGGGTDVPVEPFVASIDALKQLSTVLQCSNPSKPSKGGCSKVYSFTADIRTVNGPGNVSYSWQSSTSAGNGSGGFSVGAGSAITAVNKEVSLSCTKPASFSMQLALLSPAFTSSNTINVNHNCNEI